MNQLTERADAVVGRLFLGIGAVQLVFGYFLARRFLSLDLPVWLHIWFGLLLIAIGAGLAGLLDNLGGRGYERLWNVYYHPDRGIYRPVKVGFSWPAFIFGPLWAFGNRLLPIGFILLGVNILGWVADQQLSSRGSLNENSGLTSLLAFLGIGISVFVGSQGNAWIERYYRRGKFRLLEGNLAARSSAEAVAHARARSVTKEAEE